MVLCCRNCNLKEFSNGKIQSSLMGFVCRLMYTNGVCGLLHDLNKNVWEKRLDKDFNKKPMEVNEMAKDLQKNYGTWKKSQKSKRSNTK